MDGFAPAATRAPTGASSGASPGAPPTADGSGEGVAAGPAEATATRGGDALWMRGFHGVLVDVDGQTASALRHLALARRSSGLGRLDAIIALPEIRGIQRVPLAANGELHVGRNASGHLPVTEGATLFEPPPLANVPPEPLADFIDRRLTEAHFLLLPNQGRGYAVAKRALDLVIATTLLVLCAPVILALIVIIRLDSAGPAIFRQTRVTRGGREFVFFKFRTMYADARARFPDLYDLQATSSDLDATYYKLADDPRNTRVGRWLRRTTLDELPNLFNVVRGDLSMVGPRPDLPELVRRYRPEELACLFTKAGLTGVAQVAGRSLLTVRERLTLDLRYVARQTLLLDLRILWRTVVVVISGKGAF